MSSASQAMRIDLNDVVLGALARAGLRIGAAGGAMLGLGAAAMVVGMLVMVGLTPIFGALALGVSNIGLAAMALGVLALGVGSVLLGVGWLATGARQLPAALGSFAFVISCAATVVGAPIPPAFTMLALVALPAGHLFVRRVAWLPALAALTTLAFVVLASFDAERCYPHALGPLVFIAGYLGAMGIGLLSAHRMLFLARD